MRLFILFLLAWVHLCSQPGIVIAVCDRYVEDLILSLTYLRNYTGCKLPIEIWHAGDELSEENQRRLLAFEDVSIGDITEKVNREANHFRGFQIKGYLPAVSSFDEVIIMDADLIFYQDPAILLKHKGYKKTGAFFFCDQESYKFFGYSRVSGRLYHGGLLSYFQSRKALFTTLIDKPSDSFPERWNIYWSNIEPTPLTPFPSEHQESGCVVIDKKRHEVGIRFVEELNADYENTYKYVWGDKETYWLGFEMAGEPYYFNDTIPGKIMDRYSFLLPIDIAKVRLVQVVDGKIFYQQKEPKGVTHHAYFLQRSEEKLKRKLTSDEIEWINKAASFKPR